MKKESQESWDLYNGLLREFSMHGMPSTGINKLTEKETLADQEPKLFP